MYERRNISFTDKFKKLLWSQLQKRSKTSFSVSGLMTSCCSHSLHLPGWRRRETAGFSVTWASQVTTHCPSPRNGTKMNKPSWKPLDFVDIINFLFVSCTWDTGNSSNIELGDVVSRDSCSWNANSSLGAQCAYEVRSKNAGRDARCYCRTEDQFTAHISYERWC